MGSKSRSNLYTGTIVKRFRNGYGFIRSDKYPKKSHNLYFHARDAAGWKKLRVGHRVTFTLSPLTKQERKLKGLRNRVVIQVRRIL